MADRRQARRMKQLLTLLIIVGLTALGFWQIPQFGSYLLMLGLISSLVIAHELGHFWVAKKVGVKVERFGMGLPFGPALLEKKIGETTLCLHPVLLGGYVSFPDDNPDSDVPADSPRRFENQPIKNRAAIAVAGVVVNAIMAYLIMVFVYSAWGVPSPGSMVGKIMSPTSPAAAAGLMAGDVVLKADNQLIDDPRKLVSAIHAHAMQPLKLSIERKGQPMSVTVVPNQKGKIEIEITEIPRFVKLQNPVEVLGRSYGFLEEVVIGNGQAMGEIITGKRDLKEVYSVAGVIKVGGQGIQRNGIVSGLILAAMISIILAVMNILPIPMLDGGHLLYMAIEAIQGHPLKKEIQEGVAQVSFVVLIGLMGFVLWNDIANHLLKP